MALRGRCALPFVDIPKIYFLAMIDYTISDTNLHLVDSHTVSKFVFGKTLRKIRKEHPGSRVWERCICSLCLEWTVHNFFYMVGYERERTGSADLDNPCDRPEWQYIVLGIVVWPFTFKTK